MSNKNDGPSLVALRVEVVDEGRPGFMIQADVLPALRAFGIRAITVCGVSDKSERLLLAERNEVSAYARKLESKLRLMAAKIRERKARWIASGSIAAAIGEDFDELADEVEEGVRANV